MSAFRIRERRTRRWWYLGSAFVLVALLGVLYVAGASANLTGSTFGGGDGNLACNDSGVSGGGANDWNTTCAPAGGINIGYDDPSGSSDNSLGQGSKEDDPNITVVSGSIPPNKSDLTRFYEASETASGNVYLYLAWERTNVLGSANMDFEVNKNATAGFNGSFVGKITLNRTNGDLLVTYDFDNGGSRPTIGLLRWLTVGGTNPYDSSKTNANGDCFSANSLPCWGDKHVLGPALAEGAINTSPVVDGLGNGTNACPGSPATCPGLTFGEAAINLTAAGVTTASSCDFGSATTFLRSRSSTSFTSEMKDLVAPIATPINPCSSITIIKRTLNAAGSRAGDSKAFSYTATGTGISSFTGPLADATGSDVTCTGSNTCNKKVFTGLGPGSYSVTETLPVAGYALTDLTCSKSGTGTSVTPDGSSNSASSASITLGFGGSVTCIFTNQQQTGAIRVRKVSLKTDADNAPIPLQGASFTYALVTGGQAGTATAFPNQSGTDGYTCVAGLAFGTYRIAESSPPSGFNADSGTQDVTVNSAGTCTSGYTSATNNFVDTPLTNLHVHVQSVASTGGTESNVVCTNDADANIGNSPQPASGNAGTVDLYADGDTGHGGSLTPGVYTCTITIDP